jgi:hypothetical protein
MSRVPDIDRLVQSQWKLERARQVARQIEDNGRAVKALVQAMFGEDPELRKRAADVARRITERDAESLKPYADELAGLLAEVPTEESRTRWHLGLVVARVAHTREQRLRAARLMQLLIKEESNVVRCSAVEGIGQLAAEEPALRAVAEEIISRSLAKGTCAMKARARHAQRRLEKTSAKERSLA